MGSSQNVSQLGFQFSATGFEHFQVSLGGHNSLTLRDQVVTSETALNFYLVTQTTQTGDFVEQNYLHYLSSVNVELGQVPNHLLCRSV